MRPSRNFCSIPASHPMVCSGLTSGFGNRNGGKPNSSSTLGSVTPLPALAWMRVAVVGNRWEPASRHVSTSAKLLFQSCRNALDNVVFASVFEENRHCVALATEDIRELED